MRPSALLLVLGLVACDELWSSSSDVEQSRGAPVPAGPAPAVPAASPHPPGPSAARTPVDAVVGSVIVREARSNEIGTGTRVRCAAGTERLIGGGCNGIYALRGWPFGYSATDTIGAGWECRYRKDRRTAPTTAYALCQVIERARAERAPAAASGAGESEGADR